MKRGWIMVALLALVTSLGVSSVARAQDEAADPAAEEAVDGAADEAVDGTDAAENACAEDGEADDGTATEDEEGAAADTAAPAEDDDAAAAEEIELEQEESPWSPGLIISFIALSLGGGSAVLGIWVDRDKSRPVSFAYAMSFLITCAVVVGLFQGYLDALGAIQKKKDLNRMLDMVYEIAVTSGDKELIAILEEESGQKIDIPEAPAPAEDEGADEAAEDGAENPCAEGEGMDDGEATEEDGAENPCAAEADDADADATAN